MKGKLEPYQCFVWVGVEAHDEVEAAERARLMVMGACREAIDNGELRPNLKVLGSIPNRILGGDFEQMFLKPGSKDDYDYVAYAKTGKDLNIDGTPYWPRTEEYTSDSSNSDSTHR